jgi:hypothetical protein
VFAELGHLFRIEQPITFLNDFLHRDAPLRIPVRHRAVVVVATAVILVVVVATAAVSVRVFRAGPAAVCVFMLAPAGFFQRASRLQIIFGVDRHRSGSPSLLFGKQYYRFLRFSTLPREKPEKSVNAARGSANARYVSG